MPVHLELTHGIALNVEEAFNEDKGVEFQQFYGQNPEAY